MLLEVTNAFHSQVIIYLTKRSPAVKKCAAHKKAIVKKDAKFKVAAKKWL